MNSEINYQKSKVVYIDYGIFEGPSHKKLDFLEAIIKIFNSTENFVKINCLGVNDEDRDQFRSFIEEYFSRHMGITGKNRINIFEYIPYKIIGEVDRLIEDIVQNLPNENVILSTDRKKIKSIRMIQITKGEDYSSSEARPFYFNYSDLGTSADSRMSLLKIFSQLVKLMQSQEKSQTIELEEDNYSNFIDCINQNPHFVYNHESDTFEVLQKIHGFVAIGVLDLLSDFFSLTRRSERIPEEQSINAPKDISKVVIDRAIQKDFFDSLFNENKQYIRNPKEFIESLFLKLNVYDEPTILHMLDVDEIQMRVEKMYQQLWIKDINTTDIITTKSRINLFFNRCDLQYQSKELWRKKMGTINNILNDYASVYALICELSNQFIKVPDNRIYCKDIKLLVVMKNMSEQNKKNRFISLYKDKIVFFSVKDPLSKTIHPGDVVAGTVIREEPGYIVISPKKKVSREEYSILLKWGAESSLLEDDILRRISKNLPSNPLRTF